MDFAIMNEATNRTLWFDTWIVISENSTSARELLSQPRRLGVVLFGSVLTVLVILVNLTLAISVSRKRKGVPKSRPGVNWLRLNYTLAQLLVGAVVVPLNVQTELEFQWGLGPALCRAWLLLQVFLAALAHWSCLAVTVDRLVYVLSPHAYHHRMTRGRVACLLITAWLLSLATAAPPGVSMMTDPTFILDEVCAIAMTKQYALGMSAAAYFAPALMLLVGTVGVMMWSAQTRARKAQMVGVTDAQALCHKKCCPDEAYVTYVDYLSIGNVAHAVAAVNLSLVILWAPFFVMNAIVPFCQGLCVPPTLWSASLWLGLTSAVVSPLLWTVDIEVRDQVRDMWANRCCVCCVGAHPHCHHCSPHLAHHHQHDRISYTPATRTPTPTKWKFQTGSTSDMDCKYPYGGSTTSYNSASDVELIQPYAEFYPDVKNWTQEGKTNCIRSELQVQIWCELLEIAHLASNLCGPYVWWIHCIAVKNQCIRNPARTKPRKRRMRGLKVKSR